MSQHQVDLHVGARVRERRRELNLSQQAIGDALGVSFQQIQKYERGTNRVSASVLWEMSAALRVDVDYFFRGLPSANTHESPAQAQARRFKFSESGNRLCEAAARLAPEVVHGFTMAMEAVAMPPRKRAA